MGNDIINDLLNGNTYFLKEYYKTNKLDSINYTIELIRNSDKKDEILNRNMDKFKRLYPRFLFSIIYDNSNYEDIALDIYNKYYDISCFNQNMIFNLYYNTGYGKKIINDNISELIELNDSIGRMLINILLSEEEDNHDALYKISRDNNLHNRYLFMDILITFYPNYVDRFYDDITKYYKSIDGDKTNYMDIKELSRLCVAMIDNKSSYYENTKEYILNNYKYNYLSSLLLDNNKFSVNNNYLKAFKNDADRLYNSSIDYKFEIYNRYSKYISKDVLNELKKYLNYLQINGHVYPHIVGNIYKNNLEEVIKEYIDKYLSLSKDQTYEYLGHGSTCTAYRIGDYVLKLIKTKWSYEDEICPNSYLILNNLEELYLRDKKNIVTCGLEIQKYLKKSAEGINKMIVHYWIEELKKQGYVFTDALVDGPMGCNGRILDDYHDAYTDNPEELPDWFKETPLVLIDRDRVYKRGRNYKQQYTWY